MESVIYKEEACDLTDDFIDIGYMAESFEACDMKDKIFEVKRSNPDRIMTVLVSFPSFDEEFGAEIFKIDMFLAELEIDVNCYILFDKKTDDLELLNSKLEKLTILIDNEDEFGSMYGAKIVSGPLENKLTKALFVISKDGSIFYLDMPKQLDDKLDLERLKVELNKAYVTYTGVGCHG